MPRALQNLLLFGAYLLGSTLYPGSMAGEATPPGLSASATGSQTTPTLTWSSPAAITSGMALSGSQLSATASIPGTFVYTPGAGTVLGTGIQTLSATFTPADTVNYTTAAITVLLTVNATMPGGLIKPAAGSTLPGSSATFSWSAGSGATAYALSIGTAYPGSSDVYASGPVRTTFVNVTGLPTSGVTLYVRLASKINNVSQVVDYTYLEAGTPVPATILSPTSGTPLPGPNVTFSWTEGGGVTAYLLYLGTAGPGSSDLYNSSPTVSLSAGVSGLPAFGLPVYARLYSKINGALKFVDTTYMEAPPPPGSMFITTIGDSLTTGQEDGSGVQNSYPAALQANTNTGTWNLGIPGQTSTQIAVREGAVATSVTNSFSIPTANCAVTVTFTPGHEPAWNAMLSTKSYYTGVGVLGSIDGVLGYTVASLTNTFTFTPINCPASPVSVTGPTRWAPALYDLATGYPFFKGPVYIWAGRDNYSNPSAVESDVSAMFNDLTANQGNQNVTVLSIVNGNRVAEWAGGPDYKTILGINAYFAAKFPGRYFDVRSFMVSQYNPSVAIDVTDYVHDVPPTSVMANYDKSPLGACNGTLTKSMGSGDTSFQASTLTAGCYLWHIDSENVFTTGCTGTSSAYACTVYPTGRGWGGSTATAHNAGAPLTGWDWLHYNGVASPNLPPMNGLPGYLSIAKQISAQVRPPAVSSK